MRITYHNSSGQELHAKDYNLEVVKKRFQKVYSANGGRMPLVSFCAARENGEVDGVFQAFPYREGNYYRVDSSGCECSDNHYCKVCQEADSTRRDVQMAIELQEREEWHDEDMLAHRLEGKYGWNSNHAREVAELAWIELYAEKEPVREMVEEYIWTDGDEHLKAESDNGVCYREGEEWRRANPDWAFRYVREELLRVVRERNELADAIEAALRDRP